MSTPETNLFEEALQPYQNLIEGNTIDAPVDKANLFNELKVLDERGGELLAAKAISIVQYGEVMQHAYVASEDVYVQPPMTEEDDKFITAKLAVFDAIVATKSQGEKPSDPTNTHSSKTTGSKS